jgi:lipopolysaccharide/colanic/teichoic acid biosynthesis glycosyltransferase
MYKIFFKPLLDFILSLLGLIISSPLFLIVFIALLFANKGKVFSCKIDPEKTRKFLKSLSSEP